MPVNTTNPVVVGAATKKDHYDRVFDNIVALYGGEIAIAGQAALDIVIASSAGQLDTVPTGNALEVFRKNAANDGYEFAELSADVDFIGGRLTLESGVAVSTTDQPSKTTLYYTPYVSNLISLYSGTAWEVIEFAELSLSIASITVLMPHDVFIYNNAGTATLEILVWTNATTRATALVKQDGRWVKSGATTRRYVGTLYSGGIAGGNDCSDTYAVRDLWNAYNRVMRPMRRLEATDSWTYNTNSWRQANGSAFNELRFVIGLPDVSVRATVLHVGVLTGAEIYHIGTAIGLDSTTTPATGSTVGTSLARDALATSVTATFSGYPGIGRHRLVWLERSLWGTSNNTWYGDVGGAAPYTQSGIDGWVEG